MSNVFLGESLCYSGRPVVASGGSQVTARGGGRLGACPDIRPDGIYLEGQRVIRLGLQDGMLGDVGDLFAYREMWEPFVSAHYQLWKYLNDLFESTPSAKDCPEGIFPAESIMAMDPEPRAFCAELRTTRLYTSKTAPLGIQKRWNDWTGMSSADILVNATLILKDLQSTVMAVGGPYKDELIKIAKKWGIDVELPDVPEFTKQQELIARIEGAWVTMKGVLGIIGYGAGESLKMAGDTTEAISEGIKETAKAVPEVVRSPITAIGITAVVMVMGGALLIYYVPRSEKARARARG